MLEIDTENMTAQVTKKPSELAPCGLLGLHRLTLVITDAGVLVIGGGGG